MNGILLVNKKENWTSRDVVNKVGKILGTKKVGHTGTLDPLATGVLVLCIGSATKLNEILTSTYKEYEAEITLGLLTDTLDITGNELKEEKVKVNKEQILEALNKMTGKYVQEVPIYSAVKVNGRKLYEYARAGESVELPKREVDIKELELIGNIKYTDNKTIFNIRCLVSKGTYIRALVNDISNSLNTIGVMSKLTRTKQGKFKLENCYKIEDIESGNYKLISIAEALNNFPKVVVDGYLENLIKNGAVIKDEWKQEHILFVDKNNCLLALYKSYDKDKTKLKPWKMFNNND
jgi:tRNA pseudouridine55 synthase